MSLKTFHLVFVSVCLLLFAFLILWGFVLAPERSAVSFLMGATGIGGVLLLPAYAVYFLRKARRIEA